MAWRRRAHDDFANEIQSHLESARGSGHRAERARSTNGAAVTAPGFGASPPRRLGRRRRRLLVQTGLPAPIACALTPSRRQNVPIGSPLSACRRNSSCHAWLPKRRRLMPSSSPAPHSLKMQAFGRARTDGVAEVSAGRGVRLRAEQLGGVEHLRGARHPGGRQQLGRTRLEAGGDGLLIVPAFVKCLKTLESDSRHRCDTGELFARQPR